MIRTIRHAGRHGWATAALSTWLLLVAAASAPAADRAEDAAGGLPFSVADLGWVTLVMAALIVLTSLLQLAARRRRRRSLHAIVLRRTDI